MYSSIITHRLFPDLWLCMAFRSFQAFNDLRHSELIEDDRLGGRRWWQWGKLQSTQTHSTHDSVRPLSPSRGLLICDALPPEMPAGQTQQLSNVHYERMFMLVYRDYKTSYSSTNCTFERWLTNTCCKKIRWKIRISKVKWIKHLIILADNTVGYILLKVLGVIKKKDFSQYLFIS